MFAASAHAQTADLNRIRTDITRLRAQLADVQRQAQSAQRDLEQVDLELGIRTRELELATTAERALTQEQAQIESQIGGLVPRIEREKSDLRTRLVALYRLGGLSYLRMLLSLQEHRNPLEAIAMLSYLVSRDARAVTRFQMTQAQLASRRAALADRQQKLHETRLLVDQRRRDVAATLAQKQRLVAQLRVQESGTTQQLATLEEKARRLQRLVDVLSQQRRGAEPQTDIRAVQGALSWPVQGRVIERFGRQRDPKFATWTINNGVKIEARAGTAVHAVFQGTVLFSQWFKGYGNLIILDHGNRVFSLYGNVKAPLVTVGDHVATGQPIAGVGENEDAALGYLYFEVRQDNRPDDPQKWLR